MNWPVYNQSLIRRGEILLGFDVIDNWDIQIKDMNKDKVGQPFHYPNTSSFAWLFQGILSFTIQTDRHKE